MPSLLFCNRNPPDAGKDWRQEDKWMTEDEMVGWHHWLDGISLSKPRALVTDREAWQAAVVLQSMGLQIVGCDWVAELTDCTYFLILTWFEKKYDHKVISEGNDNKMYFSKFHGYLENFLTTLFSTTPTKKQTNQKINPLFTGFLSF